MLHGNVGSLGQPFQVSNPGPFTLSPAGTLTVTVQFGATVPGTSVSQFSISSDDSKHPSVPIQVTGKGN